MEMIKVNMSPNPLDVQTIHASQNDSEAREWGFELHNNGDVIDSSEITDQMVFKAYKGGTEEILPTNGSVPVTAPFLGDIKYPQGILSDQEFLYRESPTEKDGNAKIKSLYGNTLVWNQLIYNGNFTSTEGWAGQSENPTLSVANNAITVTMTSGSPSVFNPAITPSSQYPFVANHKYLFSFDLKATKAGVCLYLRANAFGGGLKFFPVLQSANTWTSYKNIVTATNAEDMVGYFGLFYGSDSGFTVGDSFSLRNLMMIDLTALGIADKTNAEILQWFADYFPLNYYSFNSGSLLSFNGSGIKTVGFNQWDEEWEAGALSVTDGSTLNVTTYLRSKNFIPVISGKTYCRGISYQSDCRVFYYDANYSYVGSVPTTSTNTLFTIPNGVSFIKFHKYGANYDNNICINISGNKNGTYEPYISSTLSLPISTYFPTGMKSAGTVYDELTPTRAITRIGAVDLGSLGWYYNTSSSRFITTEQLTDAKRVANNNEVPNMVCPLFETVSLNVSADTSRNKTITIGSSDGNLRVRDSSFTDATAFTQAVNGVYLYYELATPTETSFTTASLVTENGEIPLSNEDGTLIGKCTEQLSENPGFIDAKIKLSDGDGECYSNKIQLHIERSPQ